MASEISLLCRAFCRSLHSLTGGKPMQFRSTVFVGAQGRVRAPATLKAVVAYGVKTGWLLAKGADTVAMTDKGGREFGAKNLTAAPQSRPRRLR